MSWNLLASTRRTESVDGVGDAGCHEMDRPAAKRCFLSVSQMAISDAGCGPPACTEMPGETETGVLSEARAETPAPNCTEPQARGQQEKTKQEVFLRWSARSRSIRAYRAPCLSRS